jgi:hypothetical protein
LAEVAPWDLQPYGYKKSAQLVMVLGSLSVYQILKKKKLNSPESIKIRFNLASSGGEAAKKARPAPPLAGLGERTLSSQNSEFVSYSMAPNSTSAQTFDIILPNLIHKSKKRNLK